MVNETMNAGIVEAAQIQLEDMMLEIGPGTGSHTKALVDAGARVIAVEKDPDMEALVIERFHKTGRVQVEQVDFLKWPVGYVMRKLFDEKSPTSQQPTLAKVISDLPFNNSAHIKRLLPMGDIFSRVVLLLQIPLLHCSNILNKIKFSGDECGCTCLLIHREAWVHKLLRIDSAKTLKTIVRGLIIKRNVNPERKWLTDEAALRLTDAAPAPVDSRSMIILLNFFSAPEYKCRVPRKTFFPQPRVDGGVISFDLKTKPEYPPVWYPKVFFSMISSAFSGKRRTVGNSLQLMLMPPDMKAVLVSGGFPETVRTSVPLCRPMQRF